MDSWGQKNRNPNPVQKANLLSKLLFLFTFPVFSKGEIFEPDIYKTVDSFSTTKLGNALEAAWEKEKKRKHPNLINSLIEVFGKGIIFWGIFFIVLDTFAATAKPLLIGRIVKMFNHNQKQSESHDGMMYAIQLVSCLTVTGLLKQFGWFQIELLTQKMKISCTALVYRKLLKTSVNQATRGQAINLITKDINAADMVLFCAYHMVIGIFQIFIMTYIMYSQIGISAVIGMSWLLLYFPLQGIIGKGAIWIRLQAGAVTDKRLRETQEVFTAIRVIKMYTWELFHTRAVENIRQKEMKCIRLFRCLESMSFILGVVSIKLIFCIAIVCYINLGEHLTAEKVFTITSSLAMLIGTIQFVVPLTSTHGGSMLATMKRFTTLLVREEVVPEISSNNDLKPSPKIAVENLSVSLSNIPVLHNVSFFIDTGVTIIKGPTGSGKSTLLLSLMEEVQKTSGVIDVSGNVSYASQEPWLFPGTLRQNIIFGEPYDSKRYKTIIESCSLKKDFELFANGDNTYLTDRGLNLSRGQKTRINLARCVYKTADIYLLDDCLSALDTHVATHVFRNCIERFLKNKICVLATNSDMYLNNANHILELSQGSLRCTNNSSNVNTINIEIVPENLCSIADDPGTTPNTLSDSTETSKLLEETDSADNIYKEYNKQGSIAGKVYYFYFSSAGGLWIFLTLIGMFVIAQGATSWSDYFVGIWTNAEQKLSNLRQEQNTNSTEYKDLEATCSKMLIQYILIAVLSVSLSLISYISFLHYACVTSVNIHRRILSNIVNAGMTFFDTNLSGNVLNRFSRDLGIIDEMLPIMCFQTIKAGLLVLTALGMVSIVNPFLIIPSSLLILGLYFLRKYYMRTSRSIKRLEGSTRSPIIGHINATVDGLVTIRANRMQPVLKKEFEQHQDVYNSVLYMTTSTSSAFGLAIEMLCTFYIGVIIFSVLFLKDRLLSGHAGFVITQSITLSGMVLQALIHFWSDVENDMTCVERAMLYTEVKPEQISGNSPAEWPNKGVLVYNKVNLQYPLTGDQVLKDVSFSIDSNEKLGVVGRTGAGKSSLISVLFRLYDFDGKVTLDGITTNEVSLQHLRSKISIIPQDPFLFTGTVRENLDPNNTYSDKQLWQALTDVEIKSHINSLDTLITEGGNNFSIGQKQLICLARAILQENRILVLDEATANLDTKADAAIQNTIKNNFSNCTVITIAHRIPTIMNSDKILVMDQGKVVEFGSPQMLLGNRDGIFYKMVEEVGLNC